MLVFISEIDMYTWLYADSLLFCKMNIYKIICEILRCASCYFAAKDIDIASFVVRYNSSFFISRGKAMAI